MDGRKNVRMDGLSKLTKLEELRERLTEHFDAEPDRQRLFYRGKQVWRGSSEWARHRVCVAEQLPARSSPSTELPHS